MITPWLVGMALLPALAFLMLLDGLLTHIGLALGGMGEMNGVLGALYGSNIWLGSAAKAVGSAVVVGALVMAFRRAGCGVAWGLVMGTSAGVGVYSAVVVWNITQLMLRLGVS